MNRPRRLQRTRSRSAVTPVGAIYVGRPTLWSNPFQREGIGHARSVILYRAWLAGEVGMRVLDTLHFGHDEIEGLRRWRHHLMARLPYLRGRDLQCWCPLTTTWCHAEVLLGRANGRS